MSGFSADWLALREPADARARNTRLIGQWATALADRPNRPLRITDMGAGTGASLRALSPHLPGPQAWTLVDYDADLLAIAARQPLADGVACTTRLADLATDPAPWDADTDCVSCSALLDLVSADWISRLADALARNRTPLFAMLSYDGVMACAPAHPLDEAMVAAFNRHQRSDKGFGRATGPDAADTLIRALAAHGYDCTIAESPWVLAAPQDHALIAALIAGWADAVGETGEIAADDLAGWRAARQAATTMLHVGHWDVLALPRG